MKDIKQLVLGANYVRLRSAKAQEKHRYAKSIVKLEKSYVDTMRHQRRFIQKPFTIPIFLHKNDIRNRNLNIRKILKICIKDSLLPEGGKFEVKFFTNERNTIKKNVSVQLEESFRILLNKISDRPATLNSHKHSYNRTNELGLYLDTAVDDTIGLVSPAHHQLLLESLNKNLTSDYEMVREPRQYYVQFHANHASLTSELKSPMEAVDTRWELVHSGEKLTVTVSCLEMADRIAYVGIHPKHPQYLSLVQRKIINPITSAEIEIVKATDNIISPDNAETLVGLMPNHDLAHRNLCIDENLEFHMKTDDDYDFHSSLYLNRRDRNAAAFEIQKKSAPLVPIILNPTLIKNKKTGETFKITKFSLVGYVNLVEELLGPAMELLMSLRPIISGIFEYRLSKKLSVFPTENPWIAVMILKALGLQNEIHVIDIPKVLDFCERDVSRLRPDFTQLHKGVPIDQICENFSNERSLFSDEQFSVSSQGTVSVDIIRGMLLNPTTSMGSQNVKFDESNKTFELLKLSILFDLFNNYSIKFLKNFKVNRVMIDVGFKNIFLDDPKQNIKDWNYYLIHTLLNGTRLFFEAKLEGDLKKMNETFSELLVFVNNGYWDLLNSEVMLSAKDPSQLPSSKLYLKHLMGSVVYYIHLMSRHFYPNESSFVLKNLPLIHEDFDYKVDLQRFEENLEVYERNIHDLISLNEKMKNYLKVYDSDVLNTGATMIQIISKMKEIISTKTASEHKYSIFLEVPDSYTFIRIKEFQNNINTVFSIFKTPGVFKNKQVKITSVMNEAIIRRTQKSEVADGVESYAVPNSVGVFIHLVKAAEEVSTIEEELKPWEEDEIPERISENDSADKDLTFQDILVNKEAHKLIMNDNSEFDEVFENIFESEKKKSEERQAVTKNENTNIA